MSRIYTAFGCGIEDQSGRKGCGGVCQGTILDIYDPDESFVYYQTSNCFFLKELWLYFYDYCSDSGFRIIPINGTGDWVRGNNVQLIDPGNPNGDPYERFGMAFAGTCVLCLGLPEMALAGMGILGWVALTGDIAFIASDYAEFYASLQYRNVSYTSTLGDHYQNGYVKALTLENAADASLCVGLGWLLWDQDNSGNHQLFVEARAKYVEFTGPTTYTETTITTSVKVKTNPNINDDGWNSAQAIPAGMANSGLWLENYYDHNDTFKVNIVQGQRLFARMKSPCYGTSYLSIHNPAHALKGGPVAMETGETKWLNIVADTAGYWFIRTYTNGHGLYSLTLSIDGTPLIPAKPSGPSTAPVGWYSYFSTSTEDGDGNLAGYEFDWGDGTTSTSLYGTMCHYWQYRGLYEVKARAVDTTNKWSNWSEPSFIHIAEGGSGGSGCPILHVWNGSSYVCEGLLNIHNADCLDVVANRGLVSVPQRVGAVYLFRLVEHPKTHSYIDQVKLYAVIEDHWLLPLPLVYAQHSEDGNVLLPLLFSDDWRVSEAGAEHNNGVSQSIDLRFLALPQGITPSGFMFWIEGYNDEWK